MDSSTTSSISTLRQVMGIILFSGLLGALVNLANPHRIPWVQDWSVYVESKARDAGIVVVPLSLVLEHQQAGSHMFVDARPAAEYEAGHIPGAVSLPFEELGERMDAVIKLLDANLPAIIYCSNRDCDDALLLTMELRDMGKTNLLYYVDGFEVWKEEGCPVETE